MAIVRKPHRPAKAAVDVDALINRGGSSSGAPAEDHAKAAPILLRIPAGMMKRLDAALKGRPVRLPRHTWILEAIHEKLTRESPTGG
jgi:hypothetical protein